VALSQNSKVGRKYLTWQVVALAVVPLFLVVLSLLVSRGFDETEALRNEVVHSYETRAELRHILSTHQALETGQRGFILSSDPRFLEPSDAAGRELIRSFEQLEHTLFGRAGVRSELAALRQVSEQKQLFGARLVELTRNGDAAGARRLLISGTGKVLMNEIQAFIRRMDAKEQEQLAIRTADAEAARERLRDRLILLQLLLVTLLTLAGAIAFRHWRARAEASRQIEDLAARQEAIFHSAKDGMIVLNPSGSIESLNPAAERMFGYASGELHRRDVALLFDAAPERGLVESFLKRLVARQGRTPTNLEEFTGRCRDGGTFSAEVSISPVGLAEDVRFLAVLRDVSERKNVERMKTEFVSTVSHELRTPLTSIAGSLGLIAGGAAGGIPARAARLVEIAHSNCARLIRLINDILDIEKIEAGRMMFDIKPIPLAGLLDHAVEANKAYAGDPGAVVLVEPVPAKAAVLGDEDRLMQVMTNLLSNASKFSPHGGVVEVSTERRGGQWRISVADRGPGIPEDFQPRVFSKFAQADSSDTRQKGGTGLGLSIVREIVTRLGGAVSFETEMGRGTTFHVDLPAAPPSKVEGKGEALGRLDDAGLPLILHVDDDPDMLRVVTSLFEGRAQVHSTPSVVEARASIRRYGFDAVILDIGMEDGNGLDLIPLIRKRGEGAVIVFTAQDVAPAALTEADSVLVKSKSTLDQLVADVLRLARGGARAGKGKS
jgi:PAS domain S-box-containing protein